MAILKHDKYVFCGYFYEEPSYLGLFRGVTDKWINLGTTEPQLVTVITIQKDFPKPHWHGSRWHMDLCAWLCFCGLCISALATLAFLSPFFLNVGQETHAVLTSHTACTSTPWLPSVGVATEWSQGSVKPTPTQTGVRALPNKRGWGLRTVGGRSICIWNASPWAQWTFSIMRMAYSGKS